MKKYQIDWVQGSSPLTRGKLTPRPAALALCGLIPAHAGKTSPHASMSRAMRAHPRSRGENNSQPRWYYARAGSSPLTRGKRGAPHRAEPGRRLIPAHAGKTTIPAVVVFTPEAHPRSRGENSHNSLIIVSLPGSSPLTRGKRTTCRSVRRIRGLIPAHAGKTG